MQVTRALQAALFVCISVVWLQVLLRGVTAYTFAQGMAQTTVIVALLLFVETIRRVVL